MLEWMLVKIAPTPYETKKLEAAGITNPTLASYCVWRRTVLMLAFPSLAFWGISSLGFLGADKEIFEPFNWLGKILIFLPIFAGILLVVGSAGALWHWTNPVLSNRWVMAGWLLSLGLPFIPAFFPIDVIAGEELLEQFRLDPTTHQLVNNTVAVLYMIQLVPTFVSIPFGMVRASLRIRGLLPDSALAGWILMVTLPLKIMVLVLGLVLASQMIGHVMLIVAMTLYIIGPVAYFWNRKLYTDPVTGDWEERVQKRQAIVRWAGLVALILFSVWLFTADLYGKKIVGMADGDGDPTNDPIYTYSAIIRLIFEFMGRMFMATLCFADLFLRAAIANWSSDVEQREQTINAEQRDAMYSGMKEQLLLARHRNRNGSNAEETPNETNGSSKKNAEDFMELAEDIKYPADQSSASSANLAARGCTGAMISQMSDEMQA